MNTNPQRDRPRSVTKSGYKKRIFKEFIRLQNVRNYCSPSDINVGLLEHKVLYTIPIEYLDIRNYQVEKENLKSKLQLLYGHFSNSVEYIDGIEYVIRQSRCNGPKKCIKCQQPMSRGQQVCRYPECPGHSINHTCPLTMYFAYYKYEEGKWYPNNLMFIFVVGDYPETEHNHNIDIDRERRRQR